MGGECIGFDLVARRPSAWSPSDTRGEISSGRCWLCNLRYLTPYRGVRYHLKEWAKGNLKPQNKEELFNLRYSKLRNVIERIFGVPSMPKGIQIRGTGSHCCGPLCSTQYPGYDWGDRSRWRVWRGQWWWRSDSWTTSIYNHCCGNPKGERKEGWDCDGDVEWLSCQKKIDFNELTANGIHNVILSCLQLVPSKTAHE